jgi:hypothetical protein
MHSNYRYGTVCLQNCTDFEKVSELHSEICPASYHDAYPTISIKAEVPSDAKEEEYPIPLTFVGIKAEPEVSYVSVPMLWEFKNTCITYFVNTQFMNFWYSDQLIFMSSILVKAEKYTHNIGQVGRSRHTTRLTLPPSRSVHLSCSYYTELAVLLMVTFHP